MLLAQVSHRMFPRPYKIQFIVFMSNNRRSPYPSWFSSCTPNRKMGFLVWQRLQNMNKLLQHRDIRCEKSSPVHKSFPTPSVFCGMKCPHECRGWGLRENKLVDVSELFILVAFYFHAMLSALVSTQNSLSTLPKKFQLA